MQNCSVYPSRQQPLRYSGTPANLVLVYGACAVRENKKIITVLSWTSSKSLELRILNSQETRSVLGSRMLDSPINKKSFLLHVNLPKFKFICIPCRILPCSQSCLHYHRILQNRTPRILRYHCCSRISVLLPCRGPLFLVSYRFLDFWTGSLLKQQKNTDVFKDFFQNAFFLLEPEVREQVIWTGVKVGWDVHPLRAEERRQPRHTKRKSVITELWTMVLLLYPTLFKKRKFCLPLHKE